MATITISIPRKLCDSMGEIHTGIRAVKELNEAGAPVFGSVWPTGTPRGSLTTQMTDSALVFTWSGPSKDDILEECFQ